MHANTSGNVAVTISENMLKILVVDDNRDSADSLGMLLELLGYEVFIEYSGEGAITRAAAIKPDFVLLDIGLPGISGHDAARALRENQDLQHTKIIAVTGWGQDDDRAASKDAGFDFHMVKPIDVDQLAKLIGEQS